MGAARLDHAVKLTRRERDKQDQANKQRRNKELLEENRQLKQQIENMRIEATSWKAKLQNQGE